MDVQVRPNHVGGGQGQTQSCGRRAASTHPSAALMSTQGHFAYLMVTGPGSERGKGTTIRAPGGRQGLRPAPSSHGQHADQGQGAGLPEPSSHTGSQQSQAPCSPTKSQGREGRVLLKSGPGNRGRSACGPTHVARLEFPRETGLREAWRAAIHGAAKSRI